jgi:L-ribulose-5-phosphate 4-epimerase
MDENLLRLEVAACCRLAEYLELFDFSGHASPRIPGKDTMFINSRDSVRSNIQSQDIIKVNLKNGNAVDEGIAPSEVYIHTAIYQSRPDVNAVAHLHSQAVIDLGVAKKKFIPVLPRGSVFAEGVPMYDDSRTVNTLDSGRVLAERLGKRRAVILLAHGAVVVAESLKALLFYSLSLELNARSQLAAYQSGEQPCALKDDEIRESNLLYRGRLFEKAWDYYVDKAALPFLPHHK